MKWDKLTLENLFIKKIDKKYYLMTREEQKPCFLQLQKMIYERDYCYEANDVFYISCQVDEPIGEFLISLDCRIRELLYEQSPELFKKQLTKEQVDYLYVPFYKLIVDCDILKLYFNMGFDKEFQLLNEKSKSVMFPKNFKECLFCPIIDFSSITILTNKDRIYASPTILKIKYYYTETIKKKINIEFDDEDDNDGFEYYMECLHNDPNF